MLKIRTYVLLGVLSYCAFLASMVPASFVTGLIADQQQVVSFRQVQGTVWRGSMTMDSRQFGESVSGVEFAWTINPLYCFMGRLGGKFNVSAQGLDVNGSGTVGLSRVSISDIQGTIHAKLVNQLLKKQDVEITGRIELQSLALDVDLANRTTESASGGFLWGGGKVTYRQGRRKQTVDFPGVVGDLSAQEGELGLMVAQADNQKPLLMASVAQTGVAKISILKRVLQLAGQKIKKGHADKLLFEIQEEVF